MFDMRQVTDATNRAVLNRRIKKLSKIFTATETEVKSIVRECRVFGIEWDTIHGSLRIFKDHMPVHSILIEGE